ncbi:MAG: hypothetical protein IKH86_01445 [Prevotella sp.]|nr:hypothetical protein [Prevotella sp.]
MKQILRLTMVAVALLCSTFAKADTTVVGAEDNSTAFWSVFSDYYTIKPNETLTLEFKNYSVKQYNYQNWVVAVTTDAERGAENYSEYVVLRADNYAWQYGLNTGPESSHDWFTSISSNYVWETFLDDMDGSDVVMTITRAYEKVTIHADITTAGGKSYFEDFVINCGDGEQNIRAFLLTEGGHLVIDNSKTTIKNTDLPVEGQVGKTDNTTGFFGEFSDYFTINPNQTLTIEFDNYAGAEDGGYTWYNWLVALTTDADRGGEGYSEYAVVRPDNWGWNATADTNDKSWYKSLDNFYDWDHFNSNIDGAHVIMTIERKGAEVTMQAYYTKDDVSYWERFVLDCGDGSQVMRAFLSVDHSHLIVRSSAVADNVENSVGFVDNNSLWWNAFSDDYYVAQNKTLKLQLTTYTGAANWNNWVAVVTNDAERGEATYSEIFALRSDAYGWGNDSYNAENLTNDYAETNADIWDGTTMPSEFNGATTEITLERNDNIINFKAVTTSTSGKVYTEQYTQKYADASDVRLFLVADHSHFVVEGAEIIDTPTAISRVSAERSDAAPVFNLAGQRVAKAVRGVYVQDGKKFVVK